MWEFSLNEKFILIFTIELYWIFYCIISGYNQYRKRYSIHFTIYLIIITSVPLLIVATILNIESLQIQVQISFFFPSLNDPSVILPTLHGKPLSIASLTLKVKMYSTTDGAVINQWSWVIQKIPSQNSTSWL